MTPHSDYYLRGVSDWENGYSRWECPFDGKEAAQWRAGYDARQARMEKGVRELPDAPKED